MNKSNFRVIRIVSPRTMNKQQAKAIADQFAKHFNLKEYELKEEIQEDLLGGFVVYIGGFRYDYSIKGHIAKLSEEMKNPANAEQAEDLKKNLERQKELVSQFESLQNLWAVKPEKVLDEECNRTVLLDEMRDDVGNLTNDSIVDEVGEVLSVFDGIAYVSGLDNCINDELIAFEKGTYGMAMNLEEDRIGVVLLGDPQNAREGSYCKRTGKRVSVPVGKELLGRVVDPLGRPIDGLGAIHTTRTRPIEEKAPGVLERQPVNQPLYTGITAIDAMTPIGRGQRELIIGDRQTGKTALAVDTIINQKGKGVACIYVAVGQKLTNVTQVVHSLQRYGALEYTTIVVASASDTPAMQYIAPYAGCSMAEDLMRNENKDVLIVYDDLTKHAQAYRALSLLLRRPPGREAFPGDVFYLHSRLLERAARLSQEQGGHSITALPIVETQAGDISAYIPTNVISITDGQIYLETDLFFSGQRPAINVGLSVSRVGGDAQKKAMKRVAGPLRLNLAQYRELQAFAQFGSELDASTRTILTTGSHLMEVLKQHQFSPRSLSEHVALLFLAIKGHLDDLDNSDVGAFCTSFLQFMKSLHFDWMQRIEKSGLFTEDDGKDLIEIYEDFLPQFNMELEDGATV